MDITRFFKQKSAQLDQKEEKEEEQQAKRTRTKDGTRIKFLNLLGTILKSECIDMLDYTHMINFMKSGGTIVNMGRFNQIMDKIVKGRHKVPGLDSTVQEFTKVCHSMFSHLYDLINDTVSENEAGSPDNKQINIETFMKGISEFNHGTIDFTDDQKEAIKQVCHFLYNPDMKTFGLYGFAGTGKTTLITKVINYLLHKNYISSVVLSAPTNKAVNIMKSKFRSDVDILMKNKVHNGAFSSSSKNNISLDEQLDRLEEKGYKINFLTIHKLLNYKNDFNAIGERIFVKGTKGALNNHDLIIVDECSMIPFQIITHIFEDIQKQLKSLGNDDIIKKVPKVLFVGDPAQLPPVNEKVSIIFAESKKEFDMDLFKKACIDNEATGSSNKLFEMSKGIASLINSRFTAFQNDVLEQQSITLQQIVRSNDNLVIGLCNNIRAWVLNKIGVPTIGKFKGDKVKLYAHTNKKSKLQSDWFKSALSYFKAGMDNATVSNIILTWTNRQSDDYNEAVRLEMFKGKTDKKKLDKYEIGDILILKDFYTMKETEAVVTNQSQGAKGPGPGAGSDDQKRFYTSEQIRVTDIDHVCKGFPGISEALPSKLRKLRDYTSINDKFLKTVRAINKSTTRKYNAWKLFIQKLMDTLEKDTIPETHHIYVIEDTSSAILEKEKKMSADKIKDLRTLYMLTHKDNMETIDREIIRLLWREWNKIFCEPFASVDFGTSITCHKSQGSSFYNIFVDADDVLTNPNSNEAKRCIYTALTRTSNEVHILI